MKATKKQGGAGVKGRKQAPKKEKFVENYLKNGGNGTKAAVDAGYSPKTARQQASRLLLTNVDIQQRIKERQADAQVETNEIVGTLVSHMRADIADVIPKNPIARAARAAGVSHLIKKLVIKRYWDKSKDAEVEETTVEMHNSQSAAKQLCEVFGLNKAPAENPVDSARKALEEAQTKYPQLDRAVLAKLAAETYGVQESDLIH